MQRTKRISVFLVTGLLIVGMAVFSEALGLHAGWSKGRIALLLLGLLVLAVPVLPWKKAETSEKNLESDLFALPALLVVIAIYVWFLSISGGATSNYYALLGSTFGQGELALSLRPDPALLALANPYDPAAREGIKAPLDLALFDGKFYLYWGPAPALLLAIVEPLVSGTFTDAYLLFVFLCGIFFALFRWIMYLRDRFFPEIPRWSVILSLLIAGLANPALWLLSQPKIYEAAIAGGQFFFITGTYLALTALDRPTPSTGRLALAGVFLSLAVGTRSILVFPVAFVALIVVLWLFTIHRRALLVLLTPLLAFGIPHILGAIAFAWYNWARFGSIMETGFSYALAGPNLRAHLEELFSPAYSLQNLYNYLFHPAMLKPAFPFFYPNRGLLEPVLSWQALPEIYSAQAVTGLLCAVPFTVFGIVPIAILLKQVLGRASSKQQIDIPFYWIIASLMGAFLLAFGALLMFFWAAMRYAEDFMPALILLSIIGFWQAYHSLPEGMSRSKAIAILGMVLAGISILIGTSLALANLISNGLL